MQKQGISDYGKRSDTLIEGKVTKWFEDRAFGFIRSLDGEEYFCHITKVEDEQHLNVGDRVQFHTVSTTKGVQATDVKVKRNRSHYSDERVGATSR